MIDRIDALRGTARAHDERLAEARLDNPAFVGRAREQRRLARQLALADRGRGQACVISADAGMGRSRVLKELALSARVSRAVVLEVDGAAAQSAYGVANALALALLDSLPEQARAAAAVHGSILAHASPQLAQRLGAAAEPNKLEARELRARVQEAMSAWFLALAKDQTLVLLVDGLEYADESAVALLLALARACRSARLLIGCALLSEPAGAPGGASTRALLDSARRLTLLPLTESELQLLLTSVFGQAEHLVRLVGRLFRMTGGNPGHAIDLCHQLVRQGAIRFASGSWTLPRELDEHSLSSSRQEALLARLARLHGPARTLARLLSVHSAPLSPGMCRALAAVGGEDLLPQLGTLIAELLLIPSGENLLFAHEALRRACVSELALTTISARGTC